MTAKNKDVIKGEITYHDTGTSIVEGVDFPEVRLHGVVDPDDLHGRRTARRRLRCFLDAAQFDGTYRSQDTSLLSKPPGRFNVLVFDQGEPGRTKDPAFVTGDGFSIELTGGPYTLYTRAGYIEGGNIQVDNTLLGVDIGACKATGGGRIDDPCREARAPSPAKRFRL